MRTIHIKDGGAHGAPYDIDDGEYTRNRLEYFFRLFKNVQMQGARMNL